MKDTHKVQSHRAVVEQTIADLKTFKVMQGNKISTVKDKEKELDCVIGVHNLLKLRKLDPSFDIPARRNAIPDEHILKPSISPKDVDLKIPPPITPKVKANIPHIYEFESFLASAAPKIEKAIEKGGDESTFFPNVLKRGKNLYDGAYVLQLRLQKE